MCSAVPGQRARCFCRMMREKSFSATRTTTARHLRFAHATVRWVNTVSAGSTSGQSTLKFARRGFSRSVREFEQELIRLVILFETRFHDESNGSNRLSVAALSLEKFPDEAGWCSFPRTAPSCLIGQLLRGESSYRQTVTTVRFVVNSSFY